MQAKTSDIWFTEQESHLLRKNRDTVKEEKNSLSENLKVEKFPGY